MKKILAIAALTAASVSSAHATVTPASSSDINTNPVVNTYTFQYPAQEPTVAPQFVTAVRSLDPINAQRDTVLADTSFTTDLVSTVYKVEASYDGDNRTAYSAAFSKDGGNGDPANVYATVGHSDVAHIVLIKTGEVAAGTTTVTYTVTGYHS
ncbi:hypothetical protein EI761_22060 [Salmonella enterica]|nr:hypothetical protein [Salmonella enterica]EAW0464209.1 hypothetical protein [Salmonella enterica]